MPTSDFTYRGLTVRVDDPEAADLAWLEEFLAPAFATRPRSAPDCTVRVVRDAARYARLQAPGAGVASAPLAGLVLDSGPVAMPAWESGDGELTVCNAEVRIVYVLGRDRRQVQVISAANAGTLRTALMKVVREFAMSAAWTRDSLVLHAAAVAVGERAVLISGPKNAGKTSLLLHALRASGARLLSNDRVVVDLATMPAAAHGMPTIVSLRPGSVEQIAAAAGSRAHLRYNSRHTIAECEAAAAPTGTVSRKLGFSPAQLGRALGVELIGCAVPAAIVFPQVTQQPGGLQLRRLSLDDAVQRLPDSLFGARALLHTSDVFNLSGAPPPLTLADLSDIWRRLVALTPVFECLLGLDAYAGDPTSQFTAVVLDT
ncbi:MAG: hypothetical protein ABI629_06145 [bacterium]